MRSVSHNLVFWKRKTTQLNVMYSRKSFDSHSSVDNDSMGNSLRRFGGA
jgi:hypothetical protein